ncbi:hypothetical protein A9Q94_00240 [Rhodobacterales bacterium 56_14_T64]|nr:hypothetical protein A9Q94_00240 [Rhodobacterales bacterium 56_14_T64]
MGEGALPPLGLRAHSPPRYFEQEEVSTVQETIRGIVSGANGRSPKVVLEMIRGVKTVPETIWGMVSSLNRRSPKAVSQRSLIA